MGVSTWSHWSLLRLHTYALAARICTTLHQSSGIGVPRAAKFFLASSTALMSCTVKVVSGHIACTKCHRVVDLHGTAGCCMHSSPSPSSLCKIVAKQLSIVCFTANDAAFAHSPPSCLCSQMHMRRAMQHNPICAEHAKQSVVKKRVLTELQPSLMLLVVSCAEAHNQKSKL